MDLETAFSNLDENIKIINNPLYGEASNVALIKANAEHFIIEANILELPIFNYAMGISSESQQNIYTHNFLKLVNGSPVHSSITIPRINTEENPSGRYLNSFDHDVLIAIMDLWQDQGCSKDGMVKFKQSDITSKLKLSDGGKVFKDIRESIYMLKNSSITHKNAFTFGGAIIESEKPIQFLSDYEIKRFTNSKNREVRLYEVVLAKEIVHNLLLKKIGKVRKAEYLKLRLPLAKRIFQFLEFNSINRRTCAKRQTYDLVYLSNSLSIQSIKYPAKIKERLKKSLAELKAKELYDHTFTVQEGKHFITFTDLVNMEYLVGIDKLSQFKNLVLQINSKSLFEIFPFTDFDYETLLKRYDQTIEFSGRKYSWVYHVLSVIIYQLNTPNSKKPDNILKYADSLFKKNEDTLQLPYGFTPIDIQFENNSSKQESRALFEVKKNEEQMFELKLEEFAIDYFSRMSEKEREKLTEKVKSVYEEGLFPLTPSFLRSRIIDEIKEEFRAGKMRK